VTTVPIAQCRDSSFIHATPGSLDSGNDALILDEVDHLESSPRCPAARDDALPTATTKDRRPPALLIDAALHLDPEMRFLWGLESGIHHDVRSDVSDVDSGSSLEGEPPDMGDLVVLCELNRAAELNGQTGIVMAHDFETTRYQVLLAGTHTVILVKPDNLGIMCRSWKLQTDVGLT